MLHWQWKNVHKKSEVWFHVILFSVLMHGLLMWFFFGAGSSDKASLILTLRKKSGFAPVSLKVTRTSIGESMTRDNQHGNANVQTKKKPLGKPSTKKSKETVIKKTIEKKNLKKENKVAAKPAPKKIVHPSVAKKKSDKKKIIPEEKKIASHQLPLAVPAPVIEEGALPQEITLEAYQEDQRLAQLYGAISRHWAPPVGIASDCSCEITFSIGHDRAIQKIEITKKSGVLMYDLAARKATMMTAFPLWACGKTITVRFVQ